MAADPGAASTPRIAAVSKCAPILIVSDMDRSLAYYRDELGFSDRVRTWGEPASFVIVSRGPVHLMLALADGDAAIVPNWKLREKTCTVYVWVPDARAIYDDFLARGVEIDFELYEAPHGCLEFGVSDPDGHDIAFGEVLD